MRGLFFIPVFFSLVTLAWSDPGRIIPGAQLGHFRLGMSEAQMERILGRPSTKDSAGPSYYYTWKLVGNDGQPSGLLTVYFHYEENVPDWRAEAIGTTSVNFSTKSSIRVGSDLDEIEKSYPSVKFAEAASNGVKLYDDIPDGVAFYLSQGPSDSKLKCRAIFVHRAGNHVIHRSIGQY